MAREGRDYADVLAEAQARGYAEADPTADVEGLDAVNKLVILARLAFGVWIDPGVRREPAGHDDAAPRAPPASPASPPRTSPPSRWKGARCACSQRRASPRTVRIEASVVPTAVPAGLAVRALRRRPEPGRGGRRAGRAGRVRGSRVPAAPPTASAVLGDLVAIARGLGSTWAGSAGRDRAIGHRGAARRRQNASRRRPAPATPSGTEAPDDLARPGRAPSSSSATASSCPSATRRPSSPSARARRRSCHARRLGAALGAAQPPPQDRGPEPDRQLQGPGHGRRGREGARGGGPERDLRLDRQHLGVGRRLRRRRRARVRRGPAGRQDRRRQAAPGARLRRPGDLASAATSTTRCAWSARCPSRTSTRSRSSTPSTRSASRARRPPRSRSATTWAARRTSWRSRSATPATSAPTGAASASTATPAASDARPADVGLPGGRRRAARRAATRSSTRRPSPPRSGSATRRPGTGDRGPGRVRRAGSMP